MVITGTSGSGLGAPSCSYGSLSSGPAKAYLTTTENVTQGFTLTVTNVTDYTVTFYTIPGYEIYTSAPAYPTYVKSSLRQSYTLLGNRNSQNSPIAGSKTDTIRVTVVKAGARGSTFLSGNPEAEPLGSASSIMWGVPFAPFSDADQNFPIPPGMLAAFPWLEFNMGVAKNGRRLPPLQVRLFARYSLADAPGYPELPDISFETGSGVTLIKAPQVTAIFTVTSGGPGYTISFAVPGQESAPFCTYAFTPVMPAIGIPLPSEMTVTKTWAGQSSASSELNAAPYFQSWGLIQAGSMDPDYPEVLFAPMECTVDDWHAPNQAVQRRIHLTTPGRYQSVTEISDTAEPTTVVTRTRTDYYRKMSAIVDGSQVHYFYRWIPQRVIEGYTGDADHPVPAGDTFIRTFYLGNEGVQFGQSDPGGGSAISKLNVDQMPTYTYRSWKDNSPTPTYQMDSGNGGYPRVASTDVAGNGSARTDYIYAADWNNVNRLPTSIRTKVGTKFLTETTNVYDYSGVANGQPILKVSSYAFIAPSTTASGTTPRTITDGASMLTIVKSYRDDADSSFAGLPYSVAQPDGTKVSYGYERGTYNGSGSFTVGTGDDLQITTLSGLATGGTTYTALTSGATVDTIGLVADRSTKTVQIRQRGFLKWQESFVYHANTFESVSSQSYNYVVADGSGTPSPLTDGLHTDGRLAATGSSNEVNTTIEWEPAFPDRKKSFTDATGLKTTYGYDSMGRVTSLSRAAVAAWSMPAQVTELAYDADHRIIATKSGPVGGTQVVSSTQFDTGGHPRQIISADGSVKTLDYSTGGKVATATLTTGTTASPTTSTVISTAFSDGRLNSLTGSGVVNEYHDYDFDDTDRPSHTVHLATTSGRVSISVSDLLGRVVETQSNGFGSGGAATPFVKSFSYDSNGRLSKIHTEQKSTSTSIQLSADQLTTYDAFGAVIDSGLDVNNDHALTPSSTDRYTSTTTSFSKDATSGAWWSVATTQSFLMDDTTTAVQSQSQTRLNLPSGVLAQTVTYDRYHASTSSYDNAASDTVTFSSSSAGTVETVINADSSKLVKTIVSGLLAKEEAYAAGGGAAQWSVAYSYDAQGRQTGVSDSRTGNATRHFPGGSPLPDTVSDARGTNGTTVATYGYDRAGRVYSVTDSNSNVTYTTYNARGQLEQQSGSGSNPARYEYDALGQLHILRTYRNGMTGNGDLTNWDYDANTGWLTTKSDAAAVRDGSGEVTNSAGHAVTFDYAYTATEKTVTRTLARGVTATSHYSLTTGELTQEDYSDGLTPTVKYKYTRTGDLDTVFDATSDSTTDPAQARNFSHLASDYGARSAEALSPVWYHGLVLTNQYESATNSSANTVAGRSSGFTLGYSTSAGADLDKEMAVAYGYDALGRTKTITPSYKAQGARSALSVTMTYGYKAQSPMWEQLTQGSYTVVRGFEDNRDVLKTITANWGTAIVAKYSYETNTAGQRQSALQEGAAFFDFLDKTYFKFGYDGAGQLQSAVGYLGSKPTASTTPLPGRGWGFTYDTAGSRATVSVDNEQVGYTDGAGSNGGNALNQVKQRNTLKTHVSGTSANNVDLTVNGSTVNRPAGSTYWDIALNTMGSSVQSAQIDVVANGNGASQAASVTTLFRPSSETFTYDADGNLTDDAIWHYQWDAENRLKQMSTQPAVSPSKTLYFTYDYLGRRVRKVVQVNASTVLDRKFVYDGWDLIAEFDTADNQIVRSYAWGLPQLNGGGGLVLETVHTTATLTAYDVATDGSGNVTALVNSATGALAAAYEYGPFGEPLRAEGTEATNNPFRFSSYYTDVQTGLIYFGQRYYDPGLGRFINRDLAEEQGGLNLYGFVGNNSVNDWDYLGMDDSPLNEGSGRGLSGIIAGLNSYQVNVNGQPITTVDSGGFISLAAAAHTIEAENAVWASNNDVSPGFEPSHSEWSEADILYRQRRAQVLQSRPHSFTMEDFWTVEIARGRRDREEFNGAVSFGLDMTPGVGAFKAFGEVFSGRDLITGERRHRGWSALNVVLGVLPYGEEIVPAVRRIFSAGRRLRAAESKVLVIGENMSQRVIPYAEKIGAEIYPGMPGYNSTLRAEALLDNGLYIEKAKELGYRIIDIGPDFAKRAATGTSSEAYQLERFLTKDYVGYEKAFTR